MKEERIGSIMSNFNFLESNWKDLARLGKLAEKNIFVDSNTCL